ncbi:MAG: biopolymer transporter ExbD, partial [Gemmatirosa sp.]|nr:biopolymer transporter ExbD [Gemmatirosa sp.]
MSMSTGGGGGLNSDPNVTPMIDVLMVLLIIFMVIVPSSRKTVDVQLPDPNPQPSSAPNTSQIVLSVHPGGQYEINKEPATAATLASRLKQIYDARTVDKILYIRADKNLEYAKVQDAVDIAAKAGVRVTGIISE